MNSTTTFGATPVANVSGLLTTQREWAIFAAFLALCGTVFAPAVPFIIDGGIYIDMARAMANEGALHIAASGNVENAPALSKHLTQTHHGYVYPQYPGGYAIVAAPFYKLFGIRGLIALNAMGAAVSLWLTFYIAQRLFDTRIAQWSTAMLALATFMPTYMLGVWPHMLALAFWLGAIWFAIRGIDVCKYKHRYKDYAVAGMMVGVGTMIRIDVILIAPVIFLWIRLFALPQDRIAPIAFVASLALILFFAALMNQAKFGVFSPISYGRTSGAASTSSYLPILMAGIVALGAVWLLNVPATAALVYRRLGTKVLYTAFGIGAVAFIFFAGDIITKALSGMWVLVVNLQAHNAYYQPGVERNIYGQLMFWDYPKKALVQSLPFLPLIIIPAFHFFRQRNVPALSLCLLAVAAPITFYALNQWHGGGSYSMRYFIPALPFIAMLCAYALSHLAERTGGLNRQQLLGAAVIAAIAFLAMQEFGQLSERLYAPSSLYPQWLIAMAVTIYGTLYLIEPESRRFANGTLCAGVLAIAYAATINLNEEAGHEKTRLEQQALSREIATAFNDAPLILTNSPIMLMETEQKGAAIMVATIENTAVAKQAIDAYRAAGRCVYFHNPVMTQLMAPHLPSRAITAETSWVQSKKFENDPRLAFYTLKEQDARCGF